MNTRRIRGLVAAFGVAAALAVAGCDDDSPPSPPDPPEMPTLEKKTDLP